MKEPKLKYITLWIDGRWRFLERQERQGFLKNFFRRVKRWLKRQ
jgi:hypothetical protein